MAMIEIDVEMAVMVVVVMVVAKIQRTADCGSGNAMVVMASSRW